MLRACVILLSCQAVGEIIRHLSGLPLSGPIIGFVLLLLLFGVSDEPSEELHQTSRSLLGYLPLFFVPSGVGIMRHFPLLRAYWLPILVALVISSMLAMISGAIVMQSVNKLVHRPRLDRRDGTGLVARRDG